MSGFGYSSPSVTGHRRPIQCKWLAASGPDREPHRRCSSSKNSSTSRLYSPTMSLTVHLLGTSASRPTVERNVASLALHREGETLMFDCGEGTQRQMMRYGISFSLQDIFFTHMHADHLLGVIGLIRTMALQGRSERLRLWGPRGTSRVLKRAESFGFERSTFPVEILEVSPEEPVKRNGYAIVPFPVDHRASASLGYALVEEERKG